MDKAKDFLRLISPTLPPSNSSDLGTELCQWTPRELIVKFFIIHVTVFASHAHLLHLRREKRGVTHYLFLIFFPIYGMNLIVWPFLALVFQVVRGRGDKERLLQTIGVMIGRLRAFEDQEY